MTVEESVRRKMKILAGWRNEGMPINRAKACAAVGVMKAAAWRMGFDELTDALSELVVECMSGSAPSNRALMRARASLPAGVAGSVCK